jgi:hypothetical protein
MSVFSDTTAGSRKKHLTTKLAMHIFIGLIICGIPLAVMPSLYAEQSNIINNIII